MDSEFLVFVVPLLTGYLLDILFGDPRWPSHPIRVFGNMIAFGEKFLNEGSFRFIKGAGLSLFLCSVVYFVFFITGDLLLKLNVFLYYLFASLFIFFGLANKSLLEEGEEVFKKLKEEGLEAGRKRLSWIVGRDTSRLSENQIRTAVFETLSENLSDGVIAPLFFYAMGGLPLMMTYKMINTLDSMIGYKNERYFLFGKFAARMDDVVNFFPARITAFLMAFLTLNRRSFSYIVKYGSKHASPNSGYPEAALAGILNCRFGGPNVYHGKLIDKPFIGIKDRMIEDEEFKKVKVINHLVTFVFILGIVVGFFFIR